MSSTSFSIASNLLTSLPFVDLKWMAAVSVNVLPKGVDANLSGSGAPNSLTDFGLLRGTVVTPLLMVLSEYSRNVR